MPDILQLLGNDNDLYDEIIKDYIDERSLIINDEITENVVENYVLWILKWNMEDKLIPKENRKPITLYINSPGGSVFEGNNLIEAICASKTPVRGVCLGMAASMAFRIYICCHERIAFPSSVLLMHDGEISISNSSSKAKDTMRFFENMEERTKQFVLKYTDMTEEIYDKYYDSEFYMFADGDAIKYNCVDKIIGVDVDIDILA